MAIKTYIGRDRESLFDMAMVLYNDPRGVSNIISMNPGLDLNATTYFGVAINYDDSVVYSPVAPVKTSPDPGRPDWVVQVGQSVYDLAIQLYGDLGRLPDVMKKIVPDINNPIPFATILPAEETNNYLATTLFTRKIVATSLPIFGYYILMEDSGYVLQEDGSRILIE